MTSTQRRLLAVSFGVTLAVAIGVIAAGADPERYFLVLVTVAGVLVAPMAVLGWFGSAMFGAEPTTTVRPRASGQQPRASERGTGTRSAPGTSGRREPAAADSGANDRAAAAAWRDTVIATGVVLIGVAFVGVQWRTSYVLLGVLAVAMLAQAVRQVQASRR